MLNVIGFPLQKEVLTLLKGVTVMVLEIVLFVVFEATKLISPVPLVGKPILVLEFVHVKTLALFPVKLIGIIAVLSQLKISATLLTDGIGITSIVVLSDTASQGPRGSLVVSVNTMFPKYPGGGVYVLLILLLLEKTPPTESFHVIEVAAPPNFCLVGCWSFHISDRNFQC